MTAPVRDVSEFWEMSRRQGLSQGTTQGFKRAGEILVEIAERLPDDKFRDRLAALIAEFPIPRR